MLPKLEKNAILLFDDYNFLNQEGVKAAVLESNLNIKRLFCSQNPSFELKMAHFQISVLQVCPFLL